MAKPKVTSPYQVAAILSLDPAGVGPSGVAVRTTATLGAATRLTLRYPDFTYEGNIFETSLHDDLAVFLASVVPAGHRVLFVTEDSVFRSMTVARHIGRAIGCLEGLLVDLNLAHPRNTVYVKAGAWRKGIGLRGKKRDELKLAARTYVDEWYQQGVGEDLAESVGINDHVCLNLPELWSVT